MLCVFSLRRLFVILPMKKTVDRQLSNDKVIQYLHGFQMLESTAFINQYRARSCSENESLSSSTSESSLSDPIAQSSSTSSKESSDEELDFNIGFEDISDDDDEQRCSNKTNAGRNNFSFIENIRFCWF